MGEKHGKIIRKHMAQRIGKCANVLNGEPNLLAELGIVFQVRPGGCCFCLFVDARRPGSEGADYLKAMFYNTTERGILKPKDKI